MLIYVNGLWNWSCLSCGFVSVSHNYKEECKLWFSTLTFLLCPLQALEERLKQEQREEVHALKEAHRRTLEILRQQSEQELQTLRFELEDEGKAKLGKKSTSLLKLHFWLWLVFLVFIFRTVLIHWNVSTQDLSVCAQITSPVISLKFSPAVCSDIIKESTLFSFFSTTAEEEHSQAVAQWKNLKYIYSLVACFALITLLIGIVHVCCDGRCGNHYVFNQSLISFNSDERLFLINVAPQKQNGLSCRWYNQQGAELIYLYFRFRCWFYLQVVVWSLKAVAFHHT